MIDTTQNIDGVISGWLCLMICCWLFKEWKRNMLHSHEKTKKKKKKQKGNSNTNIRAILTESGWQCSGFCVEAREKQWTHFLHKTVGSFFHQNSAQHFQWQFGCRWQRTTTNGIGLSDGKSYFFFYRLNFPNETTKNVLKFNMSAFFKWFSFFSYNRSFSSQSVEQLVYSFLFDFTEMFQLWGDWMNLANKNDGFRWNQFISFPFDMKFHSTKLINC